MQSAFRYVCYNSVKRKCIKEVRGIGKKSQIFNHFLIILDQQLHPINSC